MPAPALAQPVAGLRPATARARPGNAADGVNLRNLRLSVICVESAARYANGLSIAGLGSVNHLGPFSVM